jgi:pimeloyl-ACP methyl ester carboxylesterase
MIQWKLFNFRRPELYPRLCKYFAVVRADLNATYARHAGKWPLIAPLIGIVTGLVIVFEVVIILDGIWAFLLPGYFTHYWFIVPGVIAGLGLIMRHVTPDPDLAETLEGAPTLKGKTASLAMFALMGFLATPWGAHAARVRYRWEIVPPTPTLPTPERTGFAPVNGIRLWYATFGHGEPVILVDGGLTNANYWGLQVRALAPHYEVIVLDSRGHGRSTRTDAPFSYDLMSSDVLALMDYLHIRRAALVGFSDGGIIGLDIAIHHPDRLTRLFAFAANSDPSGVKDVSKNATFTAFIARAGREYRRMSPTPRQFQTFFADIQKMWATEPHFTEGQLSHIDVPTWIVDGDHDEIITRKNTDDMAELIPGAGEMILPQTSHFAFLQDPLTFNQALLAFLATDQ